MSATCKSDSRVVMTDDGQSCRIQPLSATWKQSLPANFSTLAKDMAKSSILVKDMAKSSTLAKDMGKYSTLPQQRRFGKEFGESKSKTYYDRTKDKD